MVTPGKYGCGQGTSGISDVLEPERQAAPELELVRVLGAAHEVAAPVGIAPPAGGVGLDVGRRPAEPELDADVVAGVRLHPGAPGGGKPRVPANLPGLVGSRDG